MTDDNQYVILKYFYELKHKQNNRLVNWDGVFKELSPQLDGTTAQKARTWWERHQYIDDANEVFVITEKGENALKVLEDRLGHNQKRKELNDKKLDLEVTALEFTVKQYPTTKWQAKWGFIISVVMAVLAAVTIIVEINKDETTKVTVPPPIDTAIYRTFYEETKIRLQADSLSLGRTKSYVDSLQTRIDTLEARAARK